MKIDIPALLDDGYGFSSSRYSLVRKRGDAKFVAMVKRSVLAGLRETSAAALKAGVESDEMCVDLSSSAGSGSVTYDFLEDDEMTSQRADMMEQDRILVSRLAVYLHEWGYKEKRIPLTVPFFRYEDAEDSDPFTMDLEVEVEPPILVHYAESAIRFSTPEPERRPSPVPPPPPSPALPRTLALDQLVSTLILKHRDRMATRKGRDRESRSRSRLREELS